MAKTATLGIRVSEELKETATEAFEKLGIPLSLGVELYLKNVVENGRLPFALSEAELAPDVDGQRQALWKSFITWDFELQGAFDTVEAEMLAKEKYGFEQAPAGKVALEYIEKRGKGSRGAQAAAADVRKVQRLSAEAKELVFAALGMDKLFVPELDMLYGIEADEWRLEHLAKKKKTRERPFYKKLFEAGPLMIEINKIPDFPIEDLSDEALLDFLNEWLLELEGYESELELLKPVVESTESFEKIKNALDTLGLSDVFYEFVSERGGFSARQRGVVSAGFSISR